MKPLAYGVAGGLALLVAGLFSAALPEALERAREGHRKSAEAACEVLQPSPHNPVLGRLPAPAPGFVLKDFAGRDVSLASLRGNVVLLNFWATWCKTCVVEMPSMERLVEKMKGKPFRLIAVSVDEDWPTVRRFFPKGTPLEVLLDQDRSTPRAYGTEKFPETFIIDRQGNVRYYVISDRDWDQPAVAECLNAIIDG